MPTFSATNRGVVAGPSHSDNLYLKLFSGETLVTFNTETVWKGRHREKTIKSGKSAQFPAIGKVTAGYHQPGEVILGQNVAHGEKVIVIDDLLLADVFVSNFEEAMNHYETRSEYTVQMGQALAQAYDQHLFAIAVKACLAGTAGAVAGMGPASNDAIGIAPTTQNVVDAIYRAAAHFDSTNIPDYDRVVFVKPDVYWDLIQDGSFLDRDFGGQGSKAKGSLPYVANFEVVPSNNLSLDHGVTTIAGSQSGVANTNYTVDATDVVALVAQKQALGTVKLMEMATEKDYQVERQGTLMISRYACGHDVLRPECLRTISAT